MSMQKINGFHVNEYLRSQIQQIKILVLTYQAKIYFTHRCQKTGANSFVTKTEDLSGLVYAVRVIGRGYNLLAIKGYISKRESGAVYSSAIRTVAHGQRFIPPAIAEQLVQFTGKNNDYLPKPHSHDVDASSVLDKLLTPSETTVISYFLSGMSISDIAKELERSRKTVAGHKNNALRKMGMKSDLELFKFHNDFFKQKIA